MKVTSASCIPSTDWWAAPLPRSLCRAAPDVSDIMETDARAKGLRRNRNQRVLDLLQPGDVLVVDALKKEYEEYKKQKLGQPQ